MKSDRAPENARHTRRKIEVLGFDPDYLTPIEQKELVDLYADLLRPRDHLRRARTSLV